MKLRSDSFVDGGDIPATFAFGRVDVRRRVALSDNRNPHLAWDDVPDGTLSFALIVHDYDVPGKADDVNQEGRTVAADLPRIDFVHWVLFDLPAESRSIEAGSYSSGVTSNGKPGPMIAHAPVPGVLHGLNDYTHWFADDARMAGDYYGYDGPCPPWNDSIDHHYVFTLYALSIDRLVVTGRVTAEAVRAAMVGQVVGVAAITGLYSLNPEIVDRRRGGTAAS